MIRFPEIQAEVQFIQKQNGTELHVLREDKIHPVISGNKFRKLKYNLEEFSKGNYNSILTFGGAYSNHILAVAAAGKELGFKTVGVIRGEELIHKINDNPTLTFAQNCGMEFKFVSRENYRNKSNPEFSEELRSEFGNSYLLPEGGTNDLAVQGCEEILGKHTENFDFICCAVGTGGTVSGIINSAKDHQQILGFPALKDSDFLKDEIKKYTIRSNWELVRQFHFGGYGKACEELINFTNNFKQKFEIGLDPVYTGKMMFGIMKLIKENYFPAGSRILAIHTGGIQGIEGMNKKLRLSNKTIIK